MKMNFCFGCCGLLLGMIVAQVGLVKGESRVAQNVASGIQQTCDYTYISDRGEPNIGSNGQIRYDEPWKVVHDGGWSLKATASDLYIFEKCR
jgi:hypothetical protein